MPGIGDFLQGMFQPQQPMAQQPGQAFQDPMQGMGPMQRFGYLKQNNPESLLSLAAGLMKGDMGAGFAAAGDSMGQHRKEFMQQQEGQRRGNATKRLLVSKGYSDEDAQMIVDSGQAGSFLKPGGDDEYQQRAAAAQQYGLTGEDATSFILSGNLPTDGRFGSARVGLQTIWGTDANGDPVLYQPSASGEAVPTKFPEGVRPLSPYDKSYQTSSGTTAGKGEGEAVATWRSMSAKMPGLETTVRKLDELADRATYTLGGQALDTARRQLNMEPRESAIARADYIATVDNQILPLLRDTFGAQFTQKEGETLRATLGDADKSPKEKQAILKAFIEQKRRDIEALALQTGQQTVPAPQSGGGSVTGTGVQWSIEP